MKTPSRLFLTGALALVATGVLADAPKASPAAPPAPPAPAADTKPADPVALRDIQTFAAVLRSIQDAYVERPDSHKLIESAIRGMLAGLDPHSEYLDASGLDQLDEQTSGEYAGLGVEVLAVDGVLRVITPIDDSPASRAGVKSGDAILSIDGTVIGQDNARDAVERLRGKPGSSVALTLRRDGAADPIELVLKRERIKVASVKARMLEPGYAYVRVSQFQVETGMELREKLRRLAGQARLSGLVLDLRSNPGGIINAAVEVSDAFLDEGTIVTTRGRVAEAQSHFDATRGDLINGAPMVVLVDGGTASAAEIVAGALKDHHRGLLIGSRTFGKGSVQTVMPLDDQRAVKLTTARYYTPNGTSIQASGIKPDIALSDLRLARPDAPASPSISERDLNGHLVGEAEGEHEQQAARDPGLDDDYALSEALNVLKGLVLARANTAPPGQG